MLHVLRAVVLQTFLITWVYAQPTVLAPPKRSNALEKLAKQMEPNLKGRADRLPQYIEHYRTKLANDTRLFAFNVEAEVTSEGSVQLNGYVEFPQTSWGLSEYLKALGFKVSNEGVSILPDEGLGKEAFGFVKTKHTLSYDSPSEPRNVVTDCLLGEPLFLLRAAGDHFLVHSGEGYLGYVAAADIHRVDAKAFARYPTGTAVRMIADHELESGLIVPAGALLKRIPSQEVEVFVALPTGATAEIPPAKCQPTAVPESQINLAISNARQLIGTPYHWGGKTSDGIDCSGLVQVAYATTGVHLPRDSNQQFLLGQLTATRWYRQGLKRGDTLYFLGSAGKIRHTAIYLGDDRYLQAEMPAVNIRSLNPEDEDYDEKRAKNFAFGKRLWQ